MKKNFLLLILIVFLFNLITPNITSAQILGGPINNCTLKHDLREVVALCSNGATVGPVTPKEWALCCIIDAVFTVSDIVFNILIALVILVVLYGAYLFLTAGGNPQKVQQGQSAMLWGLAGLLVALLAKAIASLVKVLVT